jgi:CrcB protein
MNAALLVAGGGALGALARYGMGLLGLRLFGPDFPWGTFAVNVIGGVAMGVVFTFFGDRRDMTLLLATGVLGGFTTFSSFSLEVVRMLERGSFATAALYAGGSVVLACAGVYLGMLAARTAT